jgi:uncharacterized protein YjbI with pentapeptide repeats
LVAGSRSGPWFLTPLLFLQWCTEWAAYKLGRWAFVRLLEYIGRFGVVVAAFFYLTGSEARRTARHYQAWQVINAAAGLTGSGGREDALRDLIRDRVSLEGVNLKGWTSPPRGFDLSRWFLSGSVYDSALLDTVFFTRSYLVRARFLHAKLSHSTFDSAFLTHANLDSSTILRASFRGADLRGATLRDADVLLSDFRDADLEGADLRRAKFKTVEFAGADLTGADLRGAVFHHGRFDVKSLQYANVCGVNDTSGTFSSKMKTQETVCINSDSLWSAFKDSLRLPS